MLSVHIITYPEEAGRRLLKLGDYSRRMDERRESSDNTSGFISILEEFQGFDSAMILESVFVSMLIVTDTNFDEDLINFQAEFNSLLNVVVGEYFNRLFVTASLGDWKSVISGGKNSAPTTKSILTLCHLALVNIGLSKIFSDCIKVTSSEGNYIVRKY